MNDKVLKLAKENGWLNDVIKYITDPYANILEKFDKGEWCYLRSDSSGRDFLEPIPLQYITDDERESLVEDLIEDSGIEDYDWSDMSIEEVQEELYDNLFDVLLSELDKY